jgi:HlyD family secretion protein
MMCKQNMKKINFTEVKAFLKKRKKIVIPAAILLLIVLFFALRPPKSNVASIETVKYTDLTKSVRATGQVISNTDLDLSFNKTSVVKSVRVNVGDVVRAGQILATLDQGQALAAVTEARGALLGAQAKYNKTVEGASGEDLALAQVALKNAQTDLENTKNNQATIVANAYRTLLNSSITAFALSSSDSQPTPSISGTYILDKEGEIKISVSQSGTFNTSGLFNYVVTISTTTPQPIGDSGLYIQFPSSFNYQGEWVVPIPNKKASNYLTNYNAYKNALENQTSNVATAQALVDQKQAELNLKRASARSVDIDIAQAEVLSAQGSLQAAQASFEDTVIRAPAGGTITKVDIKYGELSEAGKPVITLQDVENLYIEALINEANIAYLKVGQSVAITFDAFGGDQKFTGTIAQIDPSADANDGVVNYKIKVSLSENNIIIRPGMNANIDVLAGGAKGVLAIPNAAVMKKEGKSFVNVVTDENKKKYAEREVQTGFVGDNNLVEIVSGLKEGEKIALLKD